MIGSQIKRWQVITG